MECWPKLKELRRQYAKEMWTAKDRGELLLLGGTGAMNCLPAGLGKFHFFGGMGPNFSRIVDEPGLLAQCLEASEREGYGPDTCGTLRVTLGAYFLGQFDLSRDGRRLKPDFQLDMASCQAQSKTGQVWNEYYGVPLFLIEMVPTMEDADYLIDQMQEAIEWMEKVTGRRYQDELLIEAFKNEWEFRYLYGRICELQKAIPAPLDARMLFIIQSLALRSGRHCRETVDWLRMCLAEVQYRVDNHIAALSTERFRMGHEGMGPWYRSPIFSYPREYGAVYIGSHTMFGIIGLFREGEDYSLELGPALEELGLPLKTRGNALRALAIQWLEYSQGALCLMKLDHRAAQRVKVVEDWNMDALVVTNDRACKGITVAGMETIIALKEKGIPALVYEGDTINPADLNMAEYQARMDVLLESQGLNRLEVEVPPEEW